MPVHFDLPPLQFQDTAFVLTHLDALLLVAEPGWLGSVQVETGRQVETFEAQFVPRARRWFRNLV